MTSENRTLAAFVNEQRGGHLAPDTDEAPLPVTPSRTHTRLMDPRPLFYPNLNAT